MQNQPHTQGHFRAVVNAYAYHYGIILLFLFAKSVMVTWLVNIAISNHTSFTLKLGEVFLGLVSLAIVGSCFRDSTTNSRNYVIQSIHNVLYSMANNQITQNLQIIGGISLMLEKMGVDLLGDDDSEPESKILNEENVSTPGNPPSGIDKD